MGQVYKATSKTDGAAYAVKVLPRRSMWNVRLARRQVRAFGQVTHPAVVPFDLPAYVPSVTVRVPDVRGLAGIRQTEIVPKAVVPPSDRATERVRVIESVDGRPGAYIMYLDEHAYPEGGVFWTRGTERSTVLVSSGGAAQAVLTLHIGPTGGNVQLA